MLTSGVRALTGRGCTGPISVDYAAVLMNELCLYKRSPYYRFLFTRNHNIPAVKGLTSLYRIGRNLSYHIRRLICLRCLSLVGIHRVAINSCCPCAAVGIKGDGYIIRRPLCGKGYILFRHGEGLIILHLNIGSCPTAEGIALTSGLFRRNRLLRASENTSNLSRHIVYSVLGARCIRDRVLGFLVVRRSIAVFVLCIVNFQDVLGRIFDNGCIQNILSVFIECIILRAYHSLLGEMRCTRTIVCADSYRVANICSTAHGRTCRSSILHIIIIILNRVSACRICDFDIRIADFRLCGHIFSVLNLLILTFTIRIA